MSYYHRALEKLERIDLQLLELETVGRPSVKLICKGLRMKVNELRKVLEEWRYEPEEHRTRQLHDRKEK